MKTCLNIASGIALVIAAATGASAQDAQPKQTLMPENEEARAFQEAVGYSSAVIHGDTIYLSGVVAGPMEGDEGMEPAFVRVFEHLTKVLERLGAKHGRARYVGRNAAASPATGLASRHKAEQQALVNEALNIEG